MKVTRALDYDYLWIDSLCIIQDSRDDWERESSRMAQVYKHAVLTIVPTSALSCHDGFLHKRTIRSARIPYIYAEDEPPDGHLLLQLTEKPSNYWELDIEYSWWNCRGWTFQERLLSRRILHFCSTRMYFECKIWERVRTEGDLNLGMVSQMSLFNVEAFARPDTDDESDTSPDVGASSESPAPSIDDSVSPTPSQRGAASVKTGSQASGPPEDDVQSEVSESDSLESDHGAYLPFARWYQAMQRYTERCLTYSVDKLPAAEGLARELAAKYELGRYFAGIWENDLALGLLWMPIAESEVAFVSRVWSWPPDATESLSKTPFIVLNRTVARQPTYLAPSWSWASLDGCIQWPSFPHNHFGSIIQSAIDLLYGEIRLINVSLQLEGRSSFGRISSGYLTLEGRYCTVTISGPQHNLEETRLPKSLHHPESVNYDFRYFFYGVHDDTMEFAYAALDIEPDTLPGDLMALKIIHQPPNSASQFGVRSGLLLQRSQETPGAYQRIGVFVLIEEHLDAFDDIPPKPITLV